MRISPLATTDPMSDWFGRPLGTLLRTFEDSLGRSRTRQSMLVLAEPRGFMVSETTLADAIEFAQDIARDPSSRTPALAVLQAAEGAFLVSPVYHGPDRPFDLDPGPTKRLDLDAPGTAAPVHVAALGNTEARYFQALVTATRVVLPEFDTH